jgi:hypothetical protein
VHDLLSSRQRIFDLLNGPNCHGNLKDMVKYTVAAGFDVAIDHMNDACALANDIVRHSLWTGAAAIKAAGAGVLTAVGHAATSMIPAAGTSAPHQSSLVDALVSCDYRGIFLGEEAWNGV